MKRFTLLLVILLLVGCASKTKAPATGDLNTPTQTKVVVSEEAAVKAAKSADPRASVEGWAKWQVRLAENAEIEIDGKKETQTVWIIEASHSDGENLVIYVGATAYPPTVLRVDKTNTQYISRDKAIEAAIQSMGNAVIKEATFVERYKLDHPYQGRSETAVWIVALVGKEDTKPAGKVIVDAVTGKVISVSSPPSGQ